MATAQDFFNRVRSASEDACICQKQLKTLESKMLSLGSRNFEPRVKSSPDHHRMSRRIEMYMQREKELEKRMDEDYRIIGLSDIVIYGSDEKKGLSHTVSPVWADVLWWRYLDCSTWDRVAREVGYAPKSCRIFHDQALRWIDDNRFMSAVIDLL